MGETDGGMDTDGGRGGDRRVEIKREMDGGEEDKYRDGGVGTDRRTQRETEEYKRGLKKVKRRKNAFFWSPSGKSSVEKHGAEKETNEAG